MDADCEINFIQFAYKIDRNHWDVDSLQLPVNVPRDKQQAEPPEKPFYFAHPKAFIDSDGSYNFYDLPTERTYYFLFVVKRCCLHYYSGSEGNCDCCDHYKVSVLSRIYWWTVTGKTGYKIVADTNDKVYQNMNNVLSSEVKGKTFLKKNCKKYMDENSDSVNNVFEFGLPYTIDFVDE